MNVCIMAQEAIQNAVKYILHFGSNVLITNSLTKQVVHYKQHMKTHSWCTWKTWYKCW